MASVTNLDQDMAEVRKSKYDAKSAVEDWISNILGEDLGDGDLIDILKDGVVLCRLVNVIIPDANVKYKQSRMPFVQMENIAAFLRAVSGLGIPQYDLFLTIDLYEAKDPAQVLQTLYSFSRHAHKLDANVPLLGPKLGVKRAPVPHPKAGQNVPAWNIHQYGWMQGASQGTEKIVFGKRRDIVPDSS
ncbi:calponin homology domain-containing protein [Lipomyces arxii]|uniref:calponin homology domain-containing protein n=1 Tax=Lipomyces arxii TaxID=56418 RepID=UPI0034CF3B8C